MNDRIGTWCAAWLVARRPSTLTAALRARFLPYLAVLLVAWTPWLVLTWPGAMRDDTLAQYLQAAGIHRYYTQHPLFDTLVFGVFWRLGGALGGALAGEGIYTVVQVLGFAAGASLVLCHIRKLGAPRWLRLVGLVYLATSYVVVGSIATMGKDSLHTVFLLPMAVIFVETCLTRGRVLARTQADRSGGSAGNPLTAMALYVTWIPLAAGVALIGESIIRRAAAGNRRIGCGCPSDDGSGPKLAAYGLLFFTVLSLYASPEALFWYPIPVFLSLPLFTALPFLGGRMRSAGNALTP